MNNTFKNFEMHRFGTLSWLTLVLGACALPATGMQPAREPSASSPAAITSITLERDCSGCPTGTVVTLSRDGSAHLTKTGKARLGTEEKSAQGRVSTEDFDALARLVVSQGFFSLEDAYQDPLIQDGAWATTSVVRNGQEKRVSRRNEAAPASLKAIELAIDNLAARIIFVPR